MKEINRFNIRVYGIASWKNQLLVSDEFLQNRWTTKLPGGGLEFGEGILDCLHREFLEETGQEIKSATQFYFTDFFQQSSFKSTDQVVAIYYKCELKSPEKIVISNTKFDPTTLGKQEESFRWISLSQISPSNFTFPVDQFVIEKFLKTVR